MKLLISRMNFKMFISILTLIFIYFISFAVMADGNSEIPKGSVKMITSVEGILTYYVKVGDKVEKGTPLFFVRTNDWPVGKIKQIKEDIVYYKKTYERNKALAKTNAVAIQLLDDTWHDYRTAVNELRIAKEQVRSGFYTAPFDCEIVKCDLPETSGIADGEAVMYLKKIPASEIDNKTEEPKK